ncbi:cytidylyltransferase domain-containing protein [Brevifollis gellanilyticus]|uniref:Spore coat protein n=1 Tax=Brevifollis gellanilyticus TaxID=748831 RepID=A0A512M6W3_9BACT|nr:glycosyltransferase family protein [Brevifollis gellanilyticus]GEP42478.1 spore coat protein [Brevifollis gellanilyticus]
MKTICIIQARMGSQRLTGKVLRHLCGQSMIAHVLERVASVKHVDEVWLATSTNPENDALEAEVKRLGYHCFRGSEDDVLARYHGTIQAAKADVIVRVTGDCPLYDPIVCDAMLERFHAALQTDSPPDFMSSVFERRFPRGLDTEIFTAKALERNFNEAHLPNEREHVTPHFYHHPEKFRAMSWVNDVDLSHFRWTVDTPEDWEFVEIVYNILWKPGHLITTQEVLTLLKQRPELAALNANVEQKYSAEQKLK